jgi:hypothetical protein
MTAISKEKKNKCENYHFLKIEKNGTICLGMPEPPKLIVPLSIVHKGEERAFVKMCNTRQLHIQKLS